MFSKLAENNATLIALFPSYYPLSPFRGAALAKALDLTTVLHVLKDVANHVTADSWADALDVRQSKLTGESAHRCLDQRHFRSPRTLHLSRPFLELQVGPPDDNQKVVQPQQTSCFP